MSKIINMATARNVEIVSDKFNIMGSVMCVTMEIMHINRSLII